MAKISTINTNNIDISKTETLVNTSNTDNIYNAINIRKTRTSGTMKKTIDAIKICIEKNEDILDKLLYPNLKEDLNNKVAY